MSKTARYIFTAIGLVLLGFILWYFKNIVVYILLSLVLSLLGRPVFDLLGRIRIRKHCLPAAIRSVIHPDHSDQCDSHSFSAFLYPSS